MPSEIKQITSAEQIIAASELLDRINEQIEERGFIPPGGAPYIPRHFTTSLHDDLIHNSRAIAWLSDNAFLWAEMSELPHNRRHRIAVEKMFLTDWRRSQQDGMAMLLHFQNWADRNGCSMAYVTIQPAHDPRKQKYMERLGFKPYETVYAWLPKGLLPEHRQYLQSGEYEKALQGVSRDSPVDEGSTNIGCGVSGCLNAATHSYQFPQKGDGPKITVYICAECAGDHPYAALLEG